MPQRQADAYDDRNEAEVIEMKLMLSSIADLYLTTRVLIILDMSCTLAASWNRPDHHQC